MSIYLKDYYRQRLELDLQAMIATIISPVQTALNKSEAEVKRLRQALAKTHVLLRTQQVKSSCELYSLKQSVQ